MGLCCSSSHREEDDEYRHRRTQYSHRSIPTSGRLPSQQQRTCQQVLTAPSMVRIAQTSSTYEHSVGNITPKWEHNSNANITPIAVSNRQNVLIKPGVPLTIVPRTVTQQVAIIQVETCTACGQSDHTMANCRYRERLCFYCRREGHIISVCPAKKRQRQQKQTQRNRQHNLKRFWLQLASFTSSRNFNFCYMFQEITAVSAVSNLMFILTVFYNI